MLLNPNVPRGSSFGDDFSVPRLFALWKPCVTRGSSFVDDI
jgi:hypothetical protein